MRKEKVLNELYKNLSGYWSYEYSDYVDQNNESINFDSFMIPTSDLEPGALRLLEVDNRVVVPVDTHIRIITTSTDVLHSFAVPSLGIKVDSCPGRLNQTSMLINREGVFYGQCSEIYPQVSNSYKNLPIFYFMLRIYY